MRDWSSFCHEWVTSNATSSLLFKKMKIICAGLPKTGTTSLAKALRVLGFIVFDCEEHLDLHLNEWSDIYCEGKSSDFASMYKDVDAVTDVPPAFWFEEIYEAFPDAKVILSLRDNEEVWVKSWANQNQVIQSLGGFPNGIILKWPHVIAQRIRGKHTVFEVLDPMLNALFGSVNSKSTVLFKKKYREHNERVQAVIPKEKLLIYNVKQGWKPLCEFLGCDVPEVEFPRENIGASVMQRQIAAGYKQRKRVLFFIFAISALLAAVLYLLFK